AAVGVTLMTLAALLALPGRARRAAERVSIGTLPLMFVAGGGAPLLAPGVPRLLRGGVGLVSRLSLLFALAPAGAVFGMAALALATGRWLRAHLGPAPPLLAALAGVLVLLDVSLVPFAGWLVLAVAAVTSLGLSVLTRVGSSAGWGLDELNF